MTERKVASRKFMWYTLTAMTLIAVVMVNGDRGMTRSTREEQSKDIETDSASLMVSDSKKSIKWISIIGERSSGTRWLYEHIGVCFNHTLGVKRYLTRYKHWFQHKNATKYPHDTLVLAQFRNPYDWFEAMRVVPHHSPDHIGLKWQEFLGKPWTTKRVGMDLNISQNAMCQEDFKYRDIVSCVTEPLPKSFWKNKKIRYSEHQPFYEMRPDGSGKPFNNIMEMRSAKIRNFLDVQSHAGIADVWTIQYEYLLAKGTDHLLTKIEECTGQKRRCEAHPPQQRRKRRLSRAYARYLNTHLDWSAEGLIGYIQEEIN